jgi:L-lysine exporter family protein LysE/ArgO
MTPIIFHGMMLAFGLILPIGIQNTFVLSQGILHRQWTQAVPAVIAVALCDTILITLAILGVSAVAFQILSIRYAMGAIGIIFLAVMGWKTWRSSTKSLTSGQAKEVYPAWSPKKQVLFAVTVSFLNPHALIDTLGVIGGSASVYTDASSRIIFGTACAGVSWAWFAFLAMLGHCAGKFGSLEKTTRIIGKISAGMMWLSAVYLGRLIFME